VERREQDTWEAWEEDLKEENQLCRLTLELSPVSDSGTFSSFSLFSDLNTWILAC